MSSKSSFKKYHDIGKAYESILDYESMLSMSERLERSATTSDETYNMTLQRLSTALYVHGIELKNKAKL